MKNLIVRRSGSTDSIVQLGATYRLTLFALGRMAETIFADRPFEYGTKESEQIHGEDWQSGIRVLQRMGNIDENGGIVTSTDAFRALSVCFFLSRQKSIRTPRLRSMLRDGISILAEFCLVQVKVPYVPSYLELDPAVQAIPVVARHYREIEAIASLDLNSYVMSLSDAMELFAALRGITSLKMALLRKALGELTSEIRCAQLNVNGRKP